MLELELMSEYVIAKDSKINNITENNINKDRFSLNKKTEIIEYLKDIKNCNSLLYSETLNYLNNNTNGKISLIILTLVSIPISILSLKLNIGLMMMIEFFLIFNNAFIWNIHFMMQKKWEQERKDSEIKIKKYKVNIREKICFLKENGLFNIQRKPIQQFENELKNKGYWKNKELFKLKDVKSETLDINFQKLIKDIENLK